MGRKGAGVARLTSTRLATRYAVRVPSPPVRTLALLFVLAGVFAVPRAARACDPAFVCARPILLPNDGSTVPANASELLVNLLGGSVDLSAGGTVLAASDGSELGIVAELAPWLGVGILRLRLDGPLLEGETYRFGPLPGADSCGAPIELSSTFSVGPAAPLPTSAGMLRVGAVRVQTAASACGGDFDESLADFVYLPDPSVQPWRDLALTELIVDGGSAGGVRALVRPLRAEAVCEGDFAIVRAVSLALIVAGAPRLETNSLDVDFSCNNFEGCSIADARRSRAATPTRGAASLLVVVGLLVAYRRRRRSLA